MISLLNYRSKFISDGFVIVNDVIGEIEIAQVIRSLSAEESRKAGIRNLMSNEFVSALAYDTKLRDLVQSIAGHEMVPFKATLFSKTGKANWLVAWHQDTALPVEGNTVSVGWGPASLKEGVTFSHAPTEILSKIIALRLHLDDSTKANGPLRVIPGSHRKRLTDDEEFRYWTCKPAVECQVKKGGVLVMSPLLLHASSKCATGLRRRVLHIEYATDLEIASGVRLAVA